MRKAPSLIGGDFAGELDCVEKNKVGASARLGRNRWSWWDFSRAKLFWALLEMAFSSSEGLGKMLALKVRRKAGPGGEETGVNSFGPGGDNWAKSSAVQIQNQVSLGCHCISIERSRFDR